MNLLEHVLSTKEPWVRLAVMTPQDASELVTNLPESHRSVVIDASSCKTKRELLTVFQRALEFPSYFGHNWDAFDECITDLEWMPAKGYLIILSKAENLLSSESADHYRIFIDTMNEAGKHWAAPPEGAAATPFHTLLVVTEDKIKSRDWKLSVVKP
jgi:RNAse (barnase) inhibitor barstar